MRYFKYFQYGGQNHSGQLTVLLGLAFFDFALFRGRRALRTGPHWCVQDSRSPDEQPVAKWELTVCQLHGPQNLVEWGL